MIYEFKVKDNGFDQEEVKNTLIELDRANKELKCANDLLCDRLKQLNAKCEKLSNENKQLSKELLKKETALIQLMESTLIKKAEFDEATNLGEIKKKLHMVLTDIDDLLENTDGSNHEVVSEENLLRLQKIEVIK